MSDRVCQCEEPAEWCDRCMKAVMVRAKNFEDEARRNLHAYGLEQAANEVAREHIAGLRAALSDRVMLRSVAHGQSYCDLCGDFGRDSSAIMHKPRCVLSNDYMAPSHDTCTTCGHFPCEC